MNNQKLSKLTILPPNKTVVFYSPIEGKDVLVRTGTMSQGNSFVHAVLHAYSNDYVQMDKKGRNKLVKKVYSKISDKLLKERWIESTNNVIVQVPFQDNVVELFQDFYRYVQDEKSCQTKEGETLSEELHKNKTDANTYKILCELVSLDNLEKVLNNVYDKCPDQFLDKCKKLIRDAVKNFTEEMLNILSENIDKTKREFCINKMDKLCESILNQAENMTFKKFIKNFKDFNVSVDPFTVGILSDKFNRDIYLIDVRNRMPYQFGGSENIKGRKSIVVMWVGGVHYEIVGKLLSGNRIQRQFDQDDSFIRRINTFLFKPDLVYDQYPNLVPYLSDKRRSKSDSRSGNSISKKKSMSNSRSHSRSNSRSESDSESNSDSDSESNSDSESDSNSDSESDSN